MSTVPFASPSRELGAHLSREGVRYSVWAMGKEAVEVHIRRARNSKSEILPLEKSHDGYFTVLDGEGCAGDLYSFRVDDQKDLPDLASRYQPQGCTGPSMVIDRTAYTWRMPQWKRPAWGGQVIYEVHVGTFTQEGTYRAAIARLDHLVQLGVTAVELMPLPECTGTRNWGYDGVLLFAPYHVYGTPDELRAFVDACHERGLAVYLDVIYNHIGAVGDCTHFYSPYFALPEDKGTWGKSFNLDGKHSQPVRDFLLQNVTYWLDEFRIDGFRFDATHAIHDESKSHFMAEAVELVRARGGITMVEDDRNSAELFKPVSDGGWRIDAAWADDFHHTVRVSQTQEDHSYLGRFTGSLEEIGETLRHGWLFRGQVQPNMEVARGTACQHLSPASFIHCISNHDQVGNRPFGDRLHQVISPEAYRALSLFFCLTPYTPLLFMGQEWAASSPFLFFSDHPGDFGRLVTEGRNREFRFETQKLHKPLPDCQAESTFQDSKLRWDEIEASPHRETLSLYREALRLRREYFGGKNPERDCWSVEVGTNQISLIYEWPTRWLKVTMRASRAEDEELSRGESVLMRSSETHFGGDFRNDFPETIVSSDSRS